MRALRAFVLGALVAGCGVKPLVVLGDDVAVAPDDGPRDVAIDGEETTPDATALDVSAPDAAVPDGSVADVTAPDAAPPIEGGTTPTSCASNPEHDNCRVVAVRPQRAFCLGSDAPPTGAVNASPALCGLMLSPFGVDVAETNVARFAAFVTQWRAGVLPAERVLRYPNGVAVRVPLPPVDSLADFDPTGAGCTYRTGITPPVYPKEPINCVSRATAAYFCAWDGGRLPTQSEWEYVSRWWGDAPADGRPYPWGSLVPSCARANIAGCPGDDGTETRRVGTYPGGAHDLVFDLGGNVAEWVADDLVAYSTLRTLGCWNASTLDPFCGPARTGGVAQTRGGSYQSPGAATFSIARTAATTGAASPERGIRCARALP